MHVRREGPEGAPEVDFLDEQSSPGPCLRFESGRL